MVVDYIQSDAASIRMSGVDKAGHGVRPAIKAVDRKIVRRVVPPGEFGTEFIYRHQAEDRYRKLPQIAGLSQPADCIHFVDQESECGRHSGLEVGEAPNVYFVNQKVLPAHRLPWLNVGRAHRR